MKNWLLAISILFSGGIGSMAHEVKVDFSGGSSITGEVISWDGEKGVIKCDLGEITIDKSKITTESLTRIENALEVGKPVELFLANGNQVKGKVLSWDGNTVTLEADLGNISIAIEKFSDESKTKVNSIPRNKPQPTAIPSTPSSNIADPNHADDYKALSKYRVFPRLGVGPGGAGLGV